jgi:hypothetical protein
MQVARPDFTAQRIFEIKEPSVLGTVREVGFRGDLVHPTADR